MTTRFKKIYFAGANFFLSVRQFLEAEKKIRVESLLKYSDMDFTDIRTALAKDDSTREDEIEEDVRVLSVAIDSPTNIVCSKEHEGVVYYVSGYIARSIQRKVKCELCHGLFISSEDSPSIDFQEVIQDAEKDFIEESRAFTESVNRGGLKTPSDLVHLTCLSCLQLDGLVFGNPEVRALFLSMKNHRDVFVQTFVGRALDCPLLSSCLSHFCEKGHSFWDHIPVICGQFFNVMVKNRIVKENDLIHGARKRANPTSSNSRKCSKLSSH